MVTFKRRSPSSFLNPITALYVVINSAFRLVCKRISIDGRINRRKSVLVTLEMLSLRDFNSSRVEGLGFIRSVISFHEMFRIV